MFRSVYSLGMAIVLICVMLAGCQGGFSHEMSLEPDLPPAPDSADSKYWSIQADDIIHDVDVFFVHPTTYGPSPDAQFVADVNDEALNAVTDTDTVFWLTQVFSDRCNVFAPRYRQMNIKVLQLPEEERPPYMAAGLSDVKAAFSYYLEHLNNGRPFILASHSQGTNMLQVVLLQNPDILDKDKLVAVYMPGWTLTDEDLAGFGLELAQRPDQTGALVTWNTIGPDGSSPTLLPGANCVNPLSWTTDTMNYPASMNKGARIFINKDESLDIDKFTSARINEAGALVVPTPEPKIYDQLNMSLGAECYHRYDYDFFFENIRENVKLRCDTYIRNHK